jgi:hypothetical protein
MLKGIISAVFLAVACTFLYGQQPSITTFLKEGAPVEVIPGMFTTYRSDKHIYWEIPDSLIGRNNYYSDCSRPSGPGYGKDIRIFG